MSTNGKIFNLISKRFVKFSLVGILNVAINFFVFYACYHYLKFNINISGSLGFIISAFNSYFFNLRWTFRSQSVDCQKTMMCRFFLIQLFCFILHNSTLYVASNIFPINPSIGQILGIMVTTGFNYTLIKRFVF